MSSIFIFLYVFSFVKLLMESNFLGAAIVFVVFIAHISLIPVYRHYKKDKTKKLVAKILNEDLKEPFININTAPVYVLEELPDFSTVQAKKIRWIKRHNGAYKSMEDFYEKLELPKETQLKIEKVAYC